MSKKNQIKAALDAGNTVKANKIARAAKSKAKVTLEVLKPTGKAGKYVYQEAWLKMWNSEGVRNSMNISSKLPLPKGAMTTKYHTGVTTTKLAQVEKHLKKFEPSIVKEGMALVKKAVAQHKKDMTAMSKSGKFRSFKGPASHGPKRKPSGKRFKS